MFKFPKQVSKGFTLIELLVVIAIIGVLSSVVVAALNTARLKARDASVISGAQQMAALMQLEYSDNADYGNLEVGWITTAAGCNSVYAGNYATNARQICNSILNAGVPGNMLYTGNNVDFHNKFSVMVYLPYKGTYYCRGSSGASSNTDTGVSFLSPGCWANP